MKNIYLNTALAFFLSLVLAQVTMSQTADYINANHLLNLGVSINRIENTQQGFVDNEDLEQLALRAETLLHHSTIPVQATHKIVLSDSTTYQHNTIAELIKDIQSASSCYNPVFNMKSDIFALGYQLSKSLHEASTDCYECLEESLIEAQLLASDIAYNFGVSGKFQAQTYLNLVSDQLRELFLSIDHNLDADSVILQNDHLGQEVLVALSISNDVFGNVYQDCNERKEEDHTEVSLQCEVVQMESISEDSTSKTVFVQGGAEAFLWKYRPVGGTWKYELTVDSTLHIEKTVDTTYEVQVQGWCNMDASFTPFVEETYNTTYNYGYGCYSPGYSQLGCTGISQTYAYLHCNTYASTIEFAFHKVGSSSWGTFKTHKKKIKYYNLQPNTYYEFKCRIWCGSGWSAWSSGKRFKTKGYSCYVYKPSVSHITSYSAKTHSSHGGKKKWAIKEQGGSWYYYTSYGSVKWKCKPGRTYYVKVRRVCHGKWSGWSSPVSWTTPGSCHAPGYSSLSHYNIGQSTATTKVNVSASNYYWAIRPRGGSWKYFERTSNVMNWINMSSGTTYEYKVKIYCGSGYWSHYSSTRSFTTKISSCHAPSTGSIWYSQLTSSTVRINIATSASRIEYAIWRDGWSDWKVFERSSKHIDFTGLYDNRKYYYKVRVHCGSGWSSWSYSEWFITKMAGRTRQSLVSEEVTTSDHEGPTSLWKENGVEVSDSMTTLDEKYPEISTSTTGSEESSLQHTILTYPNPATDYFRIRGINNTAEITIINMQGQAVMTLNIEKNTAVNVSSLPAGIYQLMVRQSGKTNPSTSKISIVK